MIGDVLNKMSHNTYEYIDFTLKKRYGKEYEERKYFEGIETPIMRFKEKIVNSLNFAKMFHLSIKNIAKTFHESTLQFQYRTFLNLLKIHYHRERRPEIGQEVEGAIFQIAEVDKGKCWKHLQRKAKMIKLVMGTL